MTSPPTRRVACSAWANCPSPSATAPRPRIAPWVEAIAELDEDIADAFLAEREIDAARPRRPSGGRPSPTIRPCGSAEIGLGSRRRAGAAGSTDYLPGPAISRLRMAELDTARTRPRPAGRRRALARACLQAQHRTRPCAASSCVYSGILRLGDLRAQCRDRPSRTRQPYLEIRAGVLIALPAIFAGDIAVVGGLKEVCDGSHPAAKSRCCLQRLSSRRPSCRWPSSRRRGRTRNDWACAQRLAEDDPTFRVSTIQTGQTLIAGRQELASR